MEELLFLLLLKVDMNKLFNFYWKKENQMLIFLLRFFLLIVFFFFFFFFFTFSFFYFFNEKDGRTPLYVAAQSGYEQIVQLLLEKGKANIDLANKVLLLIVSFSFFFFFRFLIFLFFLNVKYGGTPLFIAALKGHKQVVQLLLEKGKPNVDLSNNVLLLIISFSFSFSTFSFFYFFLM